MHEVEKGTMDGFKLIILHESPLSYHYISLFQHKSNTDAFLTRKTRRC